MSPAAAARAAQHRQNTGLCLWVSPAWLHSCPWSVVLDSGEDEMWVSCGDALHRLEAPIPLCFFYGHLISFLPSSEMQRRSLLQTKEADKVLKGLQTLLHLFGLETKAWLSKENFCLDVKLPSQYWKKPNQLIESPKHLMGQFMGFFLPCTASYCLHAVLLQYQSPCFKKKIPAFCYLIWWLTILNR